jgi:AcrR family transcriptional regulator
MGEKSTTTGSDLREAFLRLYAEKPADRITVREITDLAGYNRATFYLHFQDVPALLCSIEEEMLRELEQALIPILSSPAPFTVDMFFGAVRQVYQRHSLAISLLFAKPGSAFPGRLKEMILGHARELFRLTNQEDRSKLEAAIHYQISGVVGVITHFMAAGRGSDWEEMIGYVREFSAEGVYSVLMKSREAGMLPAGS